MCVLNTVSKGTVPGSGRDSTVPDVASCKGEDERIPLDPAEDLTVRWGWGRGHRMVTVTEQRLSQERAGRAAAQNSMH